MSNLPTDERSFDPLDLYQVRADHMACVIARNLSSDGNWEYLDFPRRLPYPQLLAELRILMLRAGYGVERVLGTQLSLDRE